MSKPIGRRSPARRCALSRLAVVSLLTGVLIGAFGVAAAVAEAVRPSQVQSGAAVDAATPGAVTAGDATAPLGVEASRTSTSDSLFGTTGDPTAFPTTTVAGSALGAEPDDPFAVGGTAATGATATGSSSTGGSSGSSASSASSFRPPDASFSINLGDVKEKPSNSVMVMLLLTLISVAPTLLIMLTSFTRIAVVLALTRNALGLQTIPPNQVIVGLALFLSLFVMKPTLQQMNDQALQPLLRGDKTQAQAFESATVPLRNFMLKQTRKDELAMFMKASGQEQPRTPRDISMSTLIPAFILSELKTAFIIGFVVFIPFLVIDIVVSSSLMSMGMMMLPPVLVSLPFKLLLFVMVDVWGLVVRSLIQSFR